MLVAGAAGEVRCWQKAAKVAAESQGNKGIAAHHKDSKVPTTCACPVLVMNAGPAQGLHP